jgi:hypothetical protein
MRFNSIMLSEGTPCIWMWPSARVQIPFIRALLLINTPSVTLTASCSTVKTRGKIKRAREREDGNCVTSFRLDAVSAPRDAPFPAQNTVRPRHPINSYPHAHTNTYYSLPPCRGAAQLSGPCPNSLYCERQWHTEASAPHCQYTREWRRHSAWP